jgi:preprotein translocase subunit YajC
MTAMVQLRMNLSHHFLNLLILAQQEGAAPEGAPAGKGPPEGDGAPGGFLGIFNNPLLPLIVIGIMFYFLLILPERKKRKELENQLNSLKKNDRVVTTGGICGVIVNANPGAKTVTLRIDDNVKIEVLRSHIAHIGPLEKADEKEIKEKKDA